MAIKTGGRKPAPSGGPLPRTRSRHTPASLGLCGLTWTQAWTGRPRAGCPPLGIHVFKEPGPALKVGLGGDSGVPHPAPLNSLEPRVSPDSDFPGGRREEPRGGKLAAKGGVRPFVAPGDRSPAGPFPEPPSLRTGRLPAAGFRGRAVQAPSWLYVPFTSTRAHYCSTSSHAAFESRALTARGPEDSSVVVAMCSRGRSRGPRSRVSNALQCRRW